MASPMLEVVDLVVRHPGRSGRSRGPRRPPRPPLFDALGFSLPPGSLTALLGANGAGKSTLLRLLQGQHRPDAGRILWQGHPIGRPERAISLMPQRSALNWHFPITVRRFVALGGLGRAPGAAAVDPEATLAALDLLPQAGCRLDALSVGQQQRALLARTLLQGAPVLLLDEPLAAIDPGARGRLLQLFRDLAAGGRTLLVSTHDWSDSLAAYDRLLLLADGRLRQIVAGEEALRCG
ncbi:MAG: ATP-binding cassette domain-containing protein [Synechococcaceae cyanobacterium]|nr:ATP-binding cassette domain-containing protein [Synechococcaceae cyanobacterium]